MKVKHGNLPLGWPSQVNSTGAWWAAYDRWGSNVWVSWDTKIFRVGIHDPTGRQIILGTGASWQEAFDAAKIFND